MALLTFSAWFLLRALRDVTRGGPWMASALLALAACFTHHLASFSVAAGGLFAAASLLSGGLGGPAGDGDGASTLRWSRLRWPAAAALAFAAGYLLPWLPRLLSQVETIRHGSWSWPITREDTFGQVLDAVYSSYDVGWYGAPEMRLSLAAFLVAVMAFLAVRGGRGDCSSPPSGPCRRS